MAAWASPARSVGKRDRSASRVYEPGTAIQNAAPQTQSTTHRTADWSAWVEITAQTPVSAK